MRCKLLFGYAFVIILSGRIGEHTKVSTVKLSSATSRVEGFKFCQILNPREMPLLSVLEGADLSILSRSMYLAIVCPTRTRNQRFWCGNQII